MSETIPPLGSAARRSLEKAGMEKLISIAHMRKNIEEFAIGLVNLRYPGKKFSDLDKLQQEGLRKEAARMLNSMNGGKRRSPHTRHRRRKTRSKRRYTRRVRL